MMQEWWQKKISLFAGIGGAFVLIQQSVLAGIMWPVYDVLRDPIAMLTANDAPFRGVFIGLQLIAVVLLLISLVAIRQQYRMRRKDELEKAIKGIAMALIIYFGISIAVPQEMATIALETGFTIPHIVNGISIMIVSVALWQFSQAAFSDEQPSLGNAVLLLAILFILFHALVSFVTLIGWPLRGFLDVLALDTLAGAYGFVCWYYGRKTAI